MTTFTIHIKNFIHLQIKHFLQCYKWLLVRFISFTFFLINTYYFMFFIYHKFLCPLLIQLFFSLLKYIHSIQIAFIIVKILAFGFLDIINYFLIFSNIIWLTLNLIIKLFIYFLDFINHFLNKNLCFGLRGFFILLIFISVIFL